MATDTPENPLFGEADIALRMFRPDRGDLVAQKLADLPLGLFAARSYLARVGMRSTLAELTALGFAGFDRSDLILRLLRAQGMAVTRDFFATRCNDQIMNWALVCAECGVGGFQTMIADADPRVQRSRISSPGPPCPSGWSCRAHCAMCRAWHRCARHWRRVWAQSGARVSPRPAPLCPAQSARQARPAQGQQAVRPARGGRGFAHRPPALPNRRNPR